MKKFGALVSRFLHSIHLLLLRWNMIEVPREMMWYYKVTREELIAHVEGVERDLWTAQEDAKLAWSRYENTNRLASGFTMSRVEICQQLRRFGMQLDGSNKIIVVGHPVPANAPPGWKSPPPVMASGIEPPPVQPFSSELIPIIAWYRLIPDEKIKGQINEEYNHFEDAKLDTSPSKNSGRPKVAKKGQPLKPILPTTSVPDPRGGTKFTGKWVWKLQYRTDELCPKILESA